MGLKLFPKNVCWRFSIENYSAETLWLTSRLKVLFKS